MVRVIIIALLVILGTRASLDAAEAGTIWNALSSRQHAQLAAGKPLVIEEIAPDLPWPRFIIYHLVNAPASKVAAVFWDSELDPKYVPNCLSVSIVSRPRPWIHEAQYTLKMPLFLPDEVYVSRNELSRPSPETYEIRWKVLESRYTKSCSGNLRIEPHGEHGEKSLLRYTNLVEPGSRIAGLMRSKAGAQVIESVQALVHQVDQEMAGSPSLIEMQLEVLEKALHQTN
jgi:Polyketide cyclase / dehydrase and lipid transport